MTNYSSTQYYHFVSNIILKYIPYLVRYRLSFAAFTAIIQFIDKQLY